MSAGRPLDVDTTSKPEAGRGQIAIGLVAPALALRLGLRALLTPAERIEIVFEATSFTEVASVPRGLDVLVVTTGAGSIGELSAALGELPTIKILLLVEEGLEPGHIRLLEAELRRADRVWGLLPLESTAEELSAAIYALAEGLVIAAPSLIEPFLRMLQPTAIEEEKLIEPLTDREGQVLQLLAQGLANKQIALQLGISEHTVKYHISGIYSKLGVANRTEAVRQGVRRGLVVL